VCRVIIRFSLVATFHADTVGRIRQSQVQATKPVDRLVHDSQQSVNQFRQ